MSYLYISIGAILGANARYFIGQYFTVRSGQAHYGTIFINISGSLVMGIFLGLWSTTRPSSDPWRLLTVTGFLGAYTTFSTFSFESLILAREKRWGQFSFNLGGSVVGGLLACLLGIEVSHHI